MTAEDPRTQTIREALAQLRGILRVHVLPADDALDSLAADLEAAREALARYGRHRGHCECVRWEPEDEFEPTCTCGLDAALARLSVGKETT